MYCLELYTSPFIAMHLHNFDYLTVILGLMFWRLYLKLFLLHFCMFKWEWQNFVLLKIEPIRIWLLLFRLERDITTWVDIKEIEIGVDPYAPEFLSPVPNAPKNSINNNPLAPCEYFHDTYLPLKYIKRIDICEPKDLWFISAKTDRSEWEFSGHLNGPWEIAPQFTSLRRLGKLSLWKVVKAHTL